MPEVHLLQWQRKYLQAEGRCNNGLPILYCDGQPLWEAVTGDDTDHADPGCERGMSMTHFVPLLCLHKGIRLTTVEQGKWGTLLHRHSTQEKRGWQLGHVLSTGSPQTDLSISSPIIRLMWRQVWWDVSMTEPEKLSAYRTTGYRPPC